MDYKTKPTSRRDLRKYANIMRKLFHVPNTGAFPVLEALERLGDVFTNCNFIVVVDKAMSPQTMARCVPNDLGGFTIEIRQSVYDGAYQRHIGAFLGFICHEICHVFLFNIGFTPLYERSFADKVLPAYCSVEWQAKALCNEVMIPYHESIDMNVEEMITTYRCSKAFALYRRSLGRKVIR